MKKLVVFYSASGNTEIVAKTIAKDLKADLCRLEEIRKRSRFLTFLVGSFAEMRGKCIDIKPVEFNVHNYDLILLGSPIWASKPVPAINTFIRNTDLKNKEVITFLTMGGTGYEKATNNMTMKIEKSLGKVIDSFGVRATRNSDAIVKETKKAIKSHLKHLD
ncbi:flavodoxin family protein [Chloroflexota bacterium]